jgi:hypothetical protein
MAEGGTATDSSRIYDYLMGRGPNPMQFTRAAAPTAAVTPTPTPVPITPTTPILEDVYDPYGNIQRGGGGNDSAEKREQREKDWTSPQDYLSIDRIDRNTGEVVKDVQSNASLAALSPGERSLHMQGVRLQHPLRTFASDVFTKVGVIPIGEKILSSFMKPFTGVNVNPAPVEDRTTYNMDVANDLQRQQEATQKLQENAAEGLGNSSMGRVGTPGGPGSNKGGGYGGAAGRTDAAGKDSDAGRGQSGSGGWGRGATGGLATHYGMEHMAHGGIANLHQYNLGSYSDGGRLLKGPGDGVSDDIPATIGHGQPARLADGEFVIPARIVSEIGNGSTDAGARELYKMMDRIQAGRRKTVGKDQVAKNSKAVRHLPA